MTALARLDFPPVWLLAAMAVVWFMAEVWAPLGDWLLWPGVALMLGGLGLAIWAASRFVPAGTTVVPHRAPSALVTDGPYRFSRNPIYLADLAILAGWALAFGTVAGLLVLIPLQQVLERRFVLPEEQRLAAAFGEDFARYRSRVRRWL